MMLSVETTNDRISDKWPLRWSREFPGYFLYRMNANSLLLVKWHHCSVLSKKFCPKNNDPEMIIREMLNSHYSVSLLGSE